MTPKKNKEISRNGLITGLLSVILVVIFTYSTLEIYRRSNQEEMQALMEMKEESKKESQAQRERSDRLMENNMMLIWKMGIMENEIKTHTILLQNIKSDSGKTSYFKYLKNEQDYIPNVSADEQSEFISNYKYRKY